MKKNLLLMALLCLTIPFVSCSKSDSDNEDEYEYEGSGRVSKTESILVGKWTPYTRNDHDYSFLKDVGWMEFWKDHTYEIHGYDKSLIFSGEWELIEPIGEYENRVVLMTIKKVGENFLNKLSTTLTKEQKLQLLNGSRMYWEIEDIHSNYMRTVGLRGIYNDGRMESNGSKIEWRK